MRPSLSSSDLRLLRPALLALSLAWASPQVLADEADQALVEVLESSLKDKKSVTLYVHGQALAGRVQRLVGKDLVELASRDLGRVVVRVERIDAVAVQ